ncbi:MAG: two-component sensor histidine kinase [Acidobacteria bacterium]|nr:MAG: two-component sensor histidine kinase [Acidobacteriota bacterium]
MKPASVRLRLTLWYLGIFAAIFMAYATGIVMAMRASLHAAIDEELGTRLAGLRTFMERHDPSVSMEDFRDEFREHSGLRPGGDLVQVSDSHGGLLFQSRSIRDYHVDPPVVVSSAPRYEIVNAGGTRMRVLTANVTVAGRRYVAQLAAPVADAYALVQRFQWLIASSIPVVLALASAAGYWLSRRALAPVDDITSTARSIGEHNLSKRLRISPSGDELQRLAETFNQMLDRLEVAFRRITQFTADASHELRTPVALVRTTAELALRQDRSEPEYREAIGEILDEAERMSGLLDSLLTLARVDSGAEALSLADVDLAAVIRDVCGRSEPLVHSKQLRLDRVLPDGRMVVHGDAHALERLFLILIDNAIKYTPSGGRIRVALETQADQAAVTIEDTGVGIPKDALPFVFDRFYRVDKVRSRQDGGAGLGLSIARWIIDAHRGSIEAESIQGNGTTFIVRIPAATASLLGDGAMT